MKGGHFTNPMRDIAVLVTCHNRRAKTLACLRSLFAQAGELTARPSVYLLDDGSTDGTSAAVRAEFPSVRVLRGNGSLYWCGGMRVAWSEAMKVDHDGYLWLNDDVELLPHALRTLLSVFADKQSADVHSPIVIGACRDPYSGHLVYGGYLWDIAKGNLPEADAVQRCYTMNGNIVLVPREVARLVGNLSPEYTHAMGDIDYGLRASKRGFHIYVAPGILGLCTANPPPKWTNPAIPFRERWRLLRSPKGLPPFEYMKLRRQCGVRLWFLVPIKVYLRVCFPGLWRLPGPEAVANEGRAN